MKLYSVDLSPYSSKVRMQVYAKGLDHIAIERPAGFLTPTWRETSPSRIGRLPMLELDDGQVIPESEVIAEYLEEIYPEPRLLGATPAESATIRALVHVADLYLTTNIFAMTGGSGAPLRQGPVRDRAVAGLMRGIESLEQMIGGEGGFACLGRLTLADCALVPALFMVENVLPATDTANPIPANPKIAAYWAAIQAAPPAARVLAEMRRGLEARIEAVRRAAEAATTG
jgi:glutathione S-transferase